MSGADRNWSLQSSVLTFCQISIYYLVVGLVTGRSSLSSPWVSVERELPCPGRCWLSTRRSITCFSEVLSETPPQSEAYA